MSNEQFDDIAVLKTLAQLRSKNLLNQEDESALVKQLQSTWGRSAAEGIRSNNQVDDDSLAILRRFSASAF